VLKTSVQIVTHPSKQERQSKQIEQTLCGKAKGANTSKTRGVNDGLVATYSTKSVAHIEVK